MSTSAASIAAPAASVAFSRRWVAAMVMMVALTMDLIDTTIVNVALPTVRRDLGASATQLEWVVSAYMLAFAASLIAAGSLGDVLGRKRVFCAGIAMFGLMSLAAGIAQTPGELIVARVVQGAAAAAMTPQLLATFRAMFSGEERGKAFGMYGMVLGFASAIGLVAGGVLTDANLFGWGWRTVFLVNVPIAAGSLAAAIRVVPETRAPQAGRPDYLAAALLTAALVAVVYPLLEGRRLGWPFWGWGMVAGGVLALVVLGALESRGRSHRVAPLLRTGLFRIPAFSAGILVQLAFAAGLQGFFVIFAVWVQTGQHYSPLRAGLTLLAFSIGSFLLAGTAAPLAQRHGRYVLVCGAFLLAAGIVGIDVGAHHVGAGADQWPLIPGLVVAGAGLALLIIPLVNVVLAAVPAEAAGGASGLLSTAQQLGGATGVAIIGTVFFGHVAGHTLRGAFIHTAPFVAVAFVIAGVLALALPHAALTDQDALAGQDAA